MRKPDRPRKRNITPPRIARQRTPPKKERRSRSSDENYTDNEEEEDTLDVGVNIISADDFIDDALSLIPKEIPAKKSSRQSSKSRRRSSPSNHRRRVME